MYACAFKSKRHTNESQQGFFPPFCFAGQTSRPLIHRSLSSSSSSWMECQEGKVMTGRVCESVLIYVCYPYVSVSVRDKGTLSETSPVLQDTLRLLISAGGERKIQSSFREFLEMYHISCFHSITAAFFCFSQTHKYSRLLYLSLA